MIITLYQATIFLSAFLLFQVQPLLGRYVLPWFGGTPGVWTVTLLFFQITLFFGYIYAHLISKRFPPKLQVSFHLTLLLVALFWLPVTPSEALKPVGNEQPTLQLLLLLTSSVAIPYAILASTSPLLQSWYSAVFPHRNAYRLYALSNIGSFGALFTYPLLVEPFLSAPDQTVMWSGGFFVFALLCGATGLSFYGKVFTSHGDHLPTLSPETVSTATKLGWLFRSATAVVVLLAITNFVSVDLAVHPLLWVVPLGIYLLTFVLTFESDRWYKPKLYSSAFVIILVVQVLFYHHPVTAALLQYLLLFVCCMLCHGSLANARPQSDNLTSFYLITSGGGALGGLFVAVIAPAIFTTYSELLIGWLLTALIVAEQVLPGLKLTFYRLAPLAALSSLAIVYTPISLSKRGGAYRNFFGVLRIDETATTASGSPVRIMLHGFTMHGLQFVDEERQFMPTSYFGEQSAAGTAFKNFKRNEPRKIGVVGLGIGTVASYGQKQDSFRFYEINPEVVRLAKEQFTYLSNCSSEQEFVLGDARIALESEASQEFDILMLDAFSGGTPPIHLMTTEAFSTYMRHLKDDGILLVNISNRFFNFSPVLYGLAKDHGLAITTIMSDGNPSDGTTPARYAVLAKSFDTLATVANLAPEPAPKPEQYVYWTDMKHDLLRLLL